MEDKLVSIDLRKTCFFFNWYIILLLLQWLLYKSCRFLSMPKFMSRMKNRLKTFNLIKYMQQLFGFWMLKPWIQIWRSQIYMCCHCWLAHLKVKGLVILMVEVGKFILLCTPVKPLYSWIIICPLDYNVECLRGSITKLQNLS